MKYIHIDGDDGRIAIEDKLDPEYGENYIGWVFIVPDDYILNIPVNKMSDPYVYEYLLTKSDTDRNLRLVPSWTETNGLSGELRLLMTCDVDQNDDVILDTMSEILIRIYGEQAAIDWRDEGECWIWPEGYPIQPKTTST